MDIRTAVVIAQDCSDGEGYQHPMGRVVTARDILSLADSFPDEVESLNWELFIRSVSPARIDA